MAFVGQPETATLKAGLLIIPQ